MWNLYRHSIHVSVYIFNTVELLLIWLYSLLSIVLGLCVCVDFLAINQHVLIVPTIFHLIAITYPFMTSSAIMLFHSYYGDVNQVHTFMKGVGGKVQGTRPCFWWKGRTTAGSTGIQGTRPGAGSFGTELWTCCRLYAPRLTFPLAAFNKVTNGSPALCAIRYCPSSNLQNEMKSLRVC